MMRDIERMIANDPEWARLNFELSEYLDSTGRSLPMYRMQFGKRHADVLRAIEQLDCSPEFAQRNFAFCSYDDRGRQMPMVRMQRE